MSFLYNLQFCKKLNNANSGSDVTLVIFASTCFCLRAGSGYGLDDRMIGVRFPTGPGNFSLRHHVQTGSGVLPASYPVGTGGSFAGGKAAGA